MTKQQAQQIAQDFIETHFGVTDTPEDSVVLLEQSTIERPYGWIFFYESKTYLETGDWRDALFGKTPLVVLNHDGTIERLRGGGGFNLSERIIYFELQHFKKTYELPEHLKDEEPAWGEPLWSPEERDDGAVH